ncbi:MEKHLA domain-containing protein [Pseudomonadota bacterium]
MSVLKPSEIASHIRLLLSSYQRLTGKVLIDVSNLSDDSLVTTLDKVPFVLVSHGTEDEPVFNYGNDAALQLFGMTWDEFTSLQSKYSAEAPTREERQHLLTEVKNKGYIDHYHGIRIAKDGHRFPIDNVTVWNVIDDDGVYCGQGATYVIAC